MDREGNKRGSMCSNSIGRLEPSESLMVSLQETLRDVCSQSVNEEKSSERGN